MSGKDVAAGYPLWAQELARRYLSRTLCQFVLHGNIHDLVPFGKKGKKAYRRVEAFMSHEFFASRQAVLLYDRANGIQFRDRASEEDFEQAAQELAAAGVLEKGAPIPRDPARAFERMERYVRHRVQQRKGVALVLPFAETLVPMNEAGATGAEERTLLVRLLNWAHDPMLLGGDFTVVLLTENLANLNRALVQSPYTASLEVELPGASERLDFLKSEIAASREWSGISKVSRAAFAHLTAGMNLLSIRGILLDAKENGRTIDRETLTEVKKDVIASEAYGLLEFVDTPYTLDDVAGYAQVREHLRQAVRALKSGRHDVLPMGYLVCGPVGTGKTFMVTCFSAEVGMPMVKLRNFRSQWQGVTEGNLEKILTLLKAMAPVCVMIDEADAALGDRNASGDSGVSSRVFSQIATFMSDTANRGRIIWFLITARPDLMPVDLKRQGRAEEHLALFAPSTREERLELYQVMCRKTGIRLTDPAVVPSRVLDEQSTFSGADMEAALTRAKFRAASEGTDQVTPEMLHDVFEDFLPPTYPDEIEFQTLQAVVESTSRNALPERYREMDRGKVMVRLEELQARVR